jgi:hypothetical protein
MKVAESTTRDKYMGGTKVEETNRNRERVLEIHTLEKYNNALIDGQIKRLETVF